MLSACSNGPEESRHHHPSSQDQNDTVSSRIGINCKDSRFNKNDLDSLKAAAQASLRAMSFDQLQITTILETSPVSLLDNGKSAIMYVLNGNLCGSGGCAVLIFHKDNNGNFHKNTQLSIAETPIYELNTSSHGYSDLGVGTKKVAAKPSLSIVRIAYDGQHYVPANPSMGKDIISRDSDDIERKLIDILPPSDNQCHS